ncbi:MAG: glycosyltransferase family 4 protein [Aggregatilineales bacterium]
MAPLHIAFVDSSGELGGAEHLLLALIDGLPAERIKALLICGQEGPFPAEARRRGIPTQVIPSPRFMSLSVVIGTRKFLNPIAIFHNLYSVVSAARQLNRQLRAAQIELVQTNTNFAHLYGGLAARLAGLPCIWYFHDLIETSRMRGSFAQIWRLLARGLATHIVGVSHAAVDALAVGSRASVIYAGVGLPGQAPLPDLRAQLGLLPDAKLVGYIGRIGYVKALDVLVRAAQPIVQAQPTIHFVLFGEAMFGEQQVKRDLIALVDQAQLTEHWHWLGYDPQATARLPELDMLVLPSRREALGLVLVEAGMMGKPVVASRVGGIPEIVVDNETGLLVSPGNPAELAAAIMRLICESSLAAEMGRRAKRRVETVFGPARYYSEFLALYARFGTERSA